jgi:flagellar protein FlbD
VIPIRLLNGATEYINAALVESVATVPDTIITLTTGRKVLTRTRPEEILAAVLDYHRRIHQPPTSVERLETPEAQTPASA